VSQANNATLETQTETVRIQVNGMMCDVSHNHFLQLAFGFLSPEDVDDLPGVNDANRELMKRLFPPVVNGFAGLDWF
jgi:hypothetical protein